MFKKADNQLIDIERDVAVSSAGQEGTIQIKNDISFDQVHLVLGTTPTFTTGTYVDNSLFERLELYVNNTKVYDLINDAEADQEPFALIFQRELMNLKQKVDMSDNYWILDLPRASGQFHNAYLKYKINTITNISDDADTEFDTDPTFHLKVRRKKPNKRYIRIFKDMERIDMSSETSLTKYLSPSEPTFRTQLLMLILTDDGSIDESNYTNIKLIRGTETIVEGSVNELQEQAKAIFQKAPTTGFIPIFIKDKISQYELQLQITGSAGTDKKIYIGKSQIRL